MALRQAATWDSNETRTDRQELLEEGLRLYEMYGKPLEQEHWGEYVAITRDGRTMIGKDLSELTREALEMLGRGHFAFKVGEVAVGKIR